MMFTKEQQEEIRRLARIEARRTVRQMQKEEFERLEKREKALDKLIAEDQDFWDD